MTRLPFSYDALHPKVRQSFQLLEIRLAEAFNAGSTPTLFKPFEGYRPPEAQHALLRQKRTKAGPWQSAHNYGLAVDFVAFATREKDGTVTEHGWSWRSDHDWDCLRECSTNRGLLNTIQWDRPHVEHSIWIAVRSHLI